ncbi:MAG: 3-dehydroquinate synthase [Candidatus Cloacimonetes bacterium HGW-Cloacimonetes-1]|jgi:3-dehydroquinate synthase|nr:MAG: 3-dehydroquinate synthase [Candidatus Cloacimonetes bacterium HGW-Cloacimonetes-1]
MAQLYTFNACSVETTIDAMNQDQLRHYLALPGKWIIADRVLLHLYPHLFAGIPLEHVLFLQAGEDAKTDAQLQLIYQWMLGNQIHRTAEIIVLGGGTVTDLAAYAVATFKRGCRLSLIPTTLIGMVDAAIGGKAGVNFEGFKNLLGCFYPASRVIITPEFLHSLALEELRQGWAEIIKMYLLSPRLQLGQIPEDLIPSVELIMQCVDLKLNFCIHDLEDRKERRWLNLGHSFAHALETVSGYKIKHGDAVLIGIGMAAKLSRTLKLIDPDTVSKIENTLSLLCPPSSQASPDTSQLIDIMLQDKKNSDSINLVLFTGWQQVDVVSVSVQDLSEDH